MSSHSNAAAGNMGASPLITIYEVHYPDPRRRASGENEDEAVSVVFFESPGEAASFRTHNGGRVVPVNVSPARVAAMKKAGLLRRRNYTRRSNGRKRIR